MKNIFYILLLLVACSPERKIQKAENLLSNTPLLSQICANRFPNKETIIYRDSVMALDTIFLELERVDTLIENDTVRIITTSPAKVITKTLVKYKEVQIENTAKVEEQRQLLIKCEGRYDVLEKKFEKSEEGRKAWRKKFYWIIFVILGFAVGYVLKQPTLSSILKKTIKSLKRG